MAADFSHHTAAVNTAAAIAVVVAAAGAVVAMTAAVVAMIAAAHIWKRFVELLTKHLLPRFHSDLGRHYCLGHVALHNPVPFYPQSLADAAHIFDQLEGLVLEPRSDIGNHIACHHMPKADDHPCRLVGWEEDDILF